MTMKRATGQLRDDTVLATLLERIKSALHPELVYLFGSRAKGVAAADSDVVEVIVSCLDRIP
jgi:predicted nucleotidyltransferase